MYSKTQLKQHPDYEIDNLGVVTHKPSGKPMKGTSITKNNRYIKIHIGNKFYALHKLVAEHFIPNPDNLNEINHINGRHDNRACALEWCTHRDNMKHAYKAGLKSNHGALNPFSKLTEDDVIAIWSLRNTKLTALQIRDRLKLNVTVGAVKSVRSGKNWKSVTSKLI